MAGMRLRYLAWASLVAPVSQAAAQQEPPVIVVTGRGLEQTPATPAYDVIELDRETIVAGSSGRIEDVLLNVAGFQQFRRSDSRSSNPSAQGAATPPAARWSCSTRCRCSTRSSATCRSRRSHPSGSRAFG
jgi:vitamin B12 transporter